MIAEYLDILTKNLPSSKTIRGKLQFNCPCCVYMGESSNDTRQRAGLFTNSNEIGYNCFNCGFKFRFKEGDKVPYRAYKLLELLRAPDYEINQIHFLEIKHVQVKPIYIPPKKEIIKKLDFKPFNFSDKAYILQDVINDLKPEDNAFKAYVYARSRGLEEYPFLMWVDSKTNKLNERLTIPFIYHNDLVGYVARAYGDVEKGERYIDHRPDQKYMFNIERVFQKSKYLILSESPLDSIHVNGVGIMRSTMSEEQIKVLRNFKGKIILHPDLNKTGLAMANIAAKEGWSVYFNPFGLDLGETINRYGRILTLQHIIENQISDPLEITIRINLGM